MRVFLTQLTGNLPIQYHLHCTHVVLFLCSTHTVLSLQYPHSTFSPQHPHSTFSTVLFLRSIISVPCEPNTVSPQYPCSTHTVLSSQCYFSAVPTQYYFSAVPKVQFLCSTHTVLFLRSTHTVLFLCSTHTVLFLRSTPTVLHLCSTHLPPHRFPRWTHSGSSSSARTRRWSQILRACWYWPISCRSPDTPSPPASRSLLPRRSICTCGCWRLTTRPSIRSRLKRADQDVVSQKLLRDILAPKLVYFVLEKNYSYQRYESNKVVVLRVSSTGDQFHQCLSTYLSHCALGKGKQCWADIFTQLKKKPSHIGQ